MYQRIRERFPSTDSRAYELLTVMGLPLIDGVFPVLVLSGVFLSTAQSIQVGILIFGGSATAAVIFSSFGNSIVNDLVAITSVVALLSIVALAEAIVAPMFDQFFIIQRLEIFTLLAIIAVAMSIGEFPYHERAPSPVTLVAIGVIVSVRIGNISGLVFAVDFEILKNTFIAMFSGFLFAVSVVGLKYIFGKQLDMEVFRKGSAISLFALVLSIIGVVPSVVPLVLLVGAGLVSIGDFQIKFADWA